MGFFDGTRALLAHGVWLSDEDIETVAEKGAAVLHNPCSNLKLGSGIARVPEMLRKGVRVALATDGAASNNSLDLWEEMRICALLHKGRLLDATSCRRRRRSTWPRAGARSRSGTRTWAASSRGSRRTSALWTWTSPIITR